MISCTFENGDNSSLRHVVVHAIVENDEKLLLVKRSTSLSLEGGKWALPGGFLDRDETASQGALRELKEETGWEGEVISIFLIKTNPDRPHEDRQNVAFTFIIKSLQKRGDKDLESSEVIWTPVTDLPPLESFAFDHGEAIELYLRYKKKAFPLPLVV